MRNQRFTHDDINKISWTEFGELLDNLIKNVKQYSQENSLTFDAIAPILRNGSIPATALGNQLGITTFLPVQVKFDYEIKKPVQLLPFVKPLQRDLGSTPKILVTECNIFTGESATLTAKIIKDVYPNSELYFACITRVFRQHEVTLPMYKEFFYSVMTNENFEADRELSEKLKLRPKITVYPWENETVELEDINSYFSS